jgi:hypothetical protein
MAKWFAVVEKATGRAVSFGTVVAAAEELERRGLEVVDVGEHPDSSKGGIDFAAQYWDAKDRRLKAVELLDRLQDILTADEFADVRTGWQSLSAAQKKAAADVIVKLLGRMRYRRPDEPVLLDPGE